MDSLTQITLGASVAVAVSGRRIGHLKAACWGGLIGTLPDLDALVDLGDPILNMIRHRAESHAILYLSLVSPVLAWIMARFPGNHQRNTTGPTFRNLLLMVWLVLMTHIAIDFLTVYGTQLARPFSDEPFGMGSVFIIDPIYTTSLLAGLIGAIVRPGAPGRRWNAMGLAIGGVYLCAGLMIQQHVTSLARNAMPAGADGAKLLVNAAPLNTVLWRLLAVTPEHYYEGWYSILDTSPHISWEKFDRGRSWIDMHHDHLHVQRIARFSKGFFSMHETNGRLFITDLRLGLEPAYSFRFDLTEARAEPPAGGRSLPPRLERTRPDLAAGLPWLWQRMLGRTEQSFHAHTATRPP